MTEDMVVEKNTEFSVQYTVNIEDKNILASSTDSTVVYLLGTLDEHLSGVTIPSEGLPIYTVKDNPSSILIGRVTYDDASRNLLFSFAESLKTDAEDGMLLNNIEFEYDVSLDGSGIGDEEETEIDFGASTSATFNLKIKENQPGKPEIEKTGSDYDSTTNQITWTVTMTSKGQTYTDPIKIKDTFTSGMIFDEVEGVNVQVNSETSSKIDSTTITNDPSNQIEFDYTLPASFATKGETVTFTYQTTLTDQILAGNIAGNGGETTNVGNHVYVTDPQGQPIGDASANQSVSTPSQWLGKEAGELVRDSGNDTATIPWTITINLNGFYDSMDEIYLHDRLDFPLNYVANSANYTIAGNSISGTGSIASFPFSASSSDVKAILGDETAGLPLKALIESAMSSSAITKPDTFTITYDSIITDYSGYLKKNQTQPKNEARLSYDWLNFDGTGTETSTSLVGGPSVSKESGASSTMLTKSGVPDPSTKTITWTVSFNQNKSTLNNPVIQDILGAGQHYVEGSCVVTAPESGVIVTGPDIEAEGPTPMEFSFGGGIISDPVTFTYQTELNGSEIDIYANNAGKSYQNTAILEVDGEEYASTGEDEGKVWYTSKVLDKTSVSYDYDTNEIVWKVTVNENRMEMTNVSLVDTIQSGTTLVVTTNALSYELYNGETLVSTTEITSTDVLGLYYDNLTQGTDLADGSFTVHLPNFAQGQHGVITYRTKVNVDSPAFAGAFSLTNGEIDIENTATLDFDEAGTSPTVTRNRKIPTKVVGKSGTILDKETIGYTIPLNANHATLPVNYLLRDTLSAGMHYVPSTVHLFTGTVNLSTGNITKTETATELIKGVDYQITFSKDENDNEQMTVRFLKATAQALYLEYWVGIDSSLAGVTSFTNTILAGEGSTPASGTSTMTRSAVLSSSGSGGLRSGFYFTIKKVDQEDSTLFLPGAEFALYDTTGTDLIATGTTNPSGELKFYGLAESTNYILRETKAPEGYDIKAGNISVTTADSGNKDVTVENTKSSDTPSTTPSITPPTTPSKPEDPVTPGTTTKSEEPNKPSTPSNVRSRIVVEKMTPEEVIKEIEELLKKPASPEREEAIKKLHEKIIRLLEEDPNYFDDASDEMKEVIQQLIKNGELKSRARLPKTGGLVGSAIVVLLGVTMIGGGIYLSKKNKEDNEEE